MTTATAQDTTTWCVQTTGGSRRQFVAAGRRLPSIHHDAGSGRIFTVASGHVLGTSASCQVCNPPAPLGAPSRAGVAVTPLPVGVAACSACCARAEAAGDRRPFPRAATWVLAPDNGRDGLSACPDHVDDVLDALTQWPDDASSWAYLVDLGAHG